MSFSLLPPEILEKIFAHLDTTSLAHCAQVSKKWRDVCARSTVAGPGHVPKIMGNIFRRLDHQSLLNCRQVCMLWKQGLDELTAKGTAILVRGRSYISLKAAEILNSRKDIRSNPFPFRTVRMSVMLNDGVAISGMIAKETDVCRKFGCHINFLILKLITCSTKRRAMLNCLRNISAILAGAKGLIGLSIHLSFVYDNAKYYNSRIDYSHCIDRDTLDKEYKIPQLQQLKAFRLVSWNFSSQETEWLYYKILKQSPNLTMFDPDFFMGFSKFHAIFSHPKCWPFQLKCLKLALSGSETTNVYQLLRQAKFPLESIYLDIFEYSCDKQPCTKVVHSLLKRMKTLKTLALSFYLNCKAVPPSGINTPGTSSSKFIRRVMTKKGHNDRCLSYDWFKPSRLLPHGSGDNAYNYNLQNLKLRGFQGTLTFLRNFRELRCLILLDYMEDGQSIFNCEEAFYENIPSLRQLYTPRFGNLDVKSIKAKMMDEQYLPIYC